MKIRPMNNYFYKKLLRNKFDYEEQIKYIAADENNSIVFSAICIASLFLIDFDTVSKLEYEEDDVHRVLSFVNAYKENADADVCLSAKEAMELVSFSKKGRISFELNKEIALLLSEYYNRFIDDSFFHYRLDIVEDVCSLIEDNH